MACCPYCLNYVSNVDFYCHSCGAEKGFLYFHGKARGAVFTIAAGVVLPILASILSLFLLQGFTPPFFVILTASMLMFAYSAYKLVIGPVWYR